MSDITPNVFLQIWFTCSRELIVEKESTRHTITSLQNGCVHFSSGCSVSPRVRIFFLSKPLLSCRLNYNTVYSHSISLWPNAPISYVVAYPNRYSRRRSRMPWMDREIVVITKSATFNTLLDAVRLDQYILWKASLVTIYRITCTIIAPTPLVAANL